MPQYPFDLLDKKAHFSADRRGFLSWIIPTPPRYNLSLGIPRILSQNTECYGIGLYPVDRDFLLRITTLDEKKSHWEIIGAWLALALLVHELRFGVPPHLFWYLYVPAIFLIAGRFGVLLQLVHEGSHGLLSKNKNRNHFLGKFLCAMPLGVNFDGYTRSHTRHHAFTNTAKDPRSDTEKYRVVDFRDPQLYLLFLKDLLGFTAISIFLDYDQSGEESERAMGKTGGFGAVAKNFAQLCLVQLLILGLLFQFNVFDYLLLWLICAVSPHMILMRVRGIAEHGLSKQLGITDFPDATVGTFNTRSFLTPKNQYCFGLLNWIEKVLIGSVNVYFHHEHHLVPNVPFYHLSELHAAIASEVDRRNPDVYAKGYFTAALRNLLLPVSFRTQAGDL